MISPAPNTIREVDRLTTGDRVALTILARSLGLAVREKTTGVVTGEHPNGEWIHVKHGQYEMTYAREWWVRQ